MRLVLAAIGLACGASLWATPGWGQDAAATAPAMSYGMFGPRTLGAPISPQPRTMFPGDPRDRLGKNFGIGMGGPISAAADRDVRNLIPRAPSNPLSPAYQAEQALTTQAIRSGVRSALPEMAPGFVPEMPEQPGLAGPEQPALEGELPPAQPMRGDAQSQPIRGKGESQPMRGPSPVSRAASRAAPVADYSDATARTILDALQRGMGDSAARVRVGMAGETAVLQGRVPTAHDRLLAEELSRLEPGVWNVRNELTVGAAGR